MTIQLFERTTCCWRRGGVELGGGGECEDASHRRRVNQSLLCTARGSERAGIQGRTLCLRLCCVKSRTGGDCIVTNWLGHLQCPLHCASDGEAEFGQVKRLPGLQQGDPRASRATSRPRCGCLLLNLICVSDVLCRRCPAACSFGHSSVKEISRIWVL